MAIDLGRERGVGEILRATLQAYRRYPFLFAVLAVGVIAPYELLRLAITGVGPFGAAESLHGHRLGLSYLFDLLDFSLVGPLISALHVHAVVEIGDGRKPKLGVVALHGLRVLPVVAATEIVANISIGVGLILFVIPGVILMLRFAVAAQSAAVDHEGWLPALRRSRALTAGHYRHIIGLLVAVWLVSGLVGIAGHAASDGSYTSVGWVAVGIAVHTVIASFGALAVAFLYFDLRSREVATQPSVSETVSLG